MTGRHRFLAEVHGLLCTGTGDVPKTKEQPTDYKHLDSGAPDASASRSLIATKRSLDMLQAADVRSPYFTLPLEAQLAPREPAEYAE